LDGAAAIVIPFNAVRFVFAHTDRLDVGHLAEATAPTAQRRRLWRPASDVRSGPCSSAEAHRRAGECERIALAFPSCSATRGWVVSQFDGLNFYACFAAFIIYRATATSRRTPL
jgi:hypothetical protein